MFLHKRTGVTLPTKFLQDYSLPSQRKATHTHRFPSKHLSGEVEQKLFTTLNLTIHLFSVDREVHLHLDSLANFATPKEGEYWLPRPAPPHQAPGVEKPGLLNPSQEHWTLLLSLPHTLPATSPSLPPCSTPTPTPGALPSRAGTGGRRAGQWSWLVLFGAAPWP